MPAKDIYHYHVRKALERENWNITHDPLIIPAGKRKLYIDLGAELIAAERADEKIAVEIKSFAGLSDMSEFHDALGQFIVYKIALAEKEPERQLFLAIPQDVYEDFFDDPFIRKVISMNEVKLIIFDHQKEEIKAWIQ
ncbi:MAG: XisH family protein [Thermoflexibacter sp.]|nr:XisH family protein [Thermoflexibacter sp.]